MGITDCMESINMPPCIWFEGGSRRNTYVSMIAGFLFASGWWFVIDAASIYPGTIPGGYFVCGVASTFSLFMVNSISNAQLRGDAFEGGCMGTQGSKILLFIGFVIGFAAVIFSCGAVAGFQSSAVKGRWPGVELLLQNLCILIASLIYKFGRTEEL